uniref:Uncharacterized protein n=1 Tax=Tetraodon nigroviridis TaxID=99883 RepID=H3CN70_TETNG
VAKRLTESQDLGNSLETKLEAARVHLGKTEKELQLRAEKNCSLSQELHEAGRQINALSFQIENLKLSHKQESKELRSLTLLQDSQELREANEKLQQKYAEAKERLKRAAAAQQERKKITEHREKRLRDKIELLEAKLEEQKLEVSLVKKNLSSCEQKYERKLNNLLQAKREFERLLFWGPGSDSSYATPFVTGFEGISQSSTRIFARGG